MYEDIEECVAKKSIHVDFELNKMSLVIQKVTALMGVLVYSFYLFGSWNEVLYLLNAP